MTQIERMRERALAWLKGKKPLTKEWHDIFDRMQEKDPSWCEFSHEELYEMYWETQNMIDRAVKELHANDKD